MNTRFLPEGELLHTPENRETLAGVAGLERAMHAGTVVEGMVTLCDENLCLHVELGAAEGIISPEEAVYCREGETRKDIAIVSRVGKPVACIILAIEWREGRAIARLSRRLAQMCCMEERMAHLRPGVLLPATVTHLEPFGAFLDIGCGVASLLSVDCISVSRISHPRDRLFPGMRLWVAVKALQRDTQRIYVTLRELLGTWEQNAAAFEVGQTVTGVVRSVESYGVFVELAPNLAGLSEVRPECAEELRERIGKSVSVYIKSILPSRMKIKLVLIDVCPTLPPPKRLKYYIDPTTTDRLTHWRYSPPGATKCVETVFEAQAEEN